MTDHSEFWKTCAHCGDRLVGKDWPPIVAEGETDRETTLHSFCDEACKATWERTD